MFLTERYHTSEMSMYELRNAEFESAFAFGKTGENAVLAWLRQKKFSIVPVTNIENTETYGDGKKRGPRVLLPDGEEMIAPDLLVYRAGNVRWVEVKRKSGWVYFHKLGIWETGIDTFMLKKYADLASQSPWPVWMLFIQDNMMTKKQPAGVKTPDRGLYGQDVKSLIRKENQCGTWGGMTYWTPDAFRFLATWDEVMSFVVDHGKG